MEQTLLVKELSKEFKLYLLGRSNSLNLSSTEFREKVLKVRVFLQTSIYLARLIQKNLEKINSQVHWNMIPLQKQE